MNFRDKIEQINKDKLTIADIDSFIPEILENAAILIYKKINDEIVETYRKNRNNNRQRQGKYKDNRLQRFICNAFG